MRKSVFMLRVENGEFKLEPFNLIPKQGHFGEDLICKEIQDYERRIKVAIKKIKNKK